jgi:hypothetical protein
MGNTEAQKTKGGDRCIGEVGSSPSGVAFQNWTLKDGPRFSVSDSGSTVACGLSETEKRSPSFKDQFWKATPKEEHFPATHQSPPSVYCVETTRVS